jgi:hypothetical protein
VLVVLITLAGLSALAARARRALSLYFLAALLTGFLFLTQVSTWSPTWAAPSFTYGLDWGTSFWYRIPPWTAIHGIWSSFGTMVFGNRANEWLAYVLTCVVYPLPYLGVHLVSRLGLRRVPAGHPKSLRILLHILSYVSVAIWALLMLTGAAAAVGSVFG